MIDTTPRTVVVLAVVAVAVAGVGLVAGSGATVDAVASDPPSDDVRIDAEAAASTAATEQSAELHPLLDCTNGTSPGVVACGYNPGPTAVALDEQVTAGDNVTVSAVELDSGGFVAVHAVSYVDGQFTESVRGVSRYLDPGLHRDVAVDLTQPVTDDTTLVAVVYRDGDDDRTFDFADADGGVDRPYTNTYAPSTGNVSDEAGQVIGDAARFTTADVTVETVTTPAEDGATVTVSVTNDGSAPLDLRAAPRAFPAGATIAETTSDGGTVTAGGDAVEWTQVQSGETVTAMFRLALSGSGDGATGTADVRVGLDGGPGAVPVEVTLPEPASPSVVAVAGDDRRVDFDEVIRAIRLHNADEPVPETGEQLSRSDVTDIIRLFNAGAPV